MSGDEGSFQDGVREVSAPAKEIKSKFKNQRKVRKWKIHVIEKRKKLLSSKNPYLIPDLSLVNLLTRLLWN